MVSYNNIYFSINSLFHTDSEGMTMLRQPDANETLVATWICLNVLKDESINHIISIIGTRVDGLMAPLPLPSQ